MNKYAELKAKHEKQINEFPMAFAFSNKQFEEAKEKLGVKSNDELLSIPCGGMIRKTDKEEYKNLCMAISVEDNAAMKDDEFLYQGFLYELANHEYCITSDPESTLDCFGLTITEVSEDKRLSDIFKKAKVAYWNGCVDNG